MAYAVVFSPEALEHLRALYRFIEKAASPLIAQRFTEAIVEHCESFKEFPARAVRRDDIRPGLHITNYRSRVVIALVVDRTSVSIVGIFYGGRDYETLLQNDVDD